ncbi:hypothetical protein pb186bvf_010517 [Paramecium bursaria]
MNQSTEIKPFSASSPIYIVENHLVTCVSDFVETQDENMCPNRRPNGAKDIRRYIEKQFPNKKKPLDGLSQLMKKFNRKKY